MLFLIKRSFHPKTIAFIMQLTSLNVLSDSDLPCARLENNRKLFQIGVSDQPILKGPTSLRVGEMGTGIRLLDGDRLLIRFNPHSKEWSVGLTPSENSATVIYNQNSHPGKDNYFLTPELKKGATIQLINGEVNLDRKLLFENSWLPSRALSIFSRSDENGLPNFIDYDAYINIQTDPEKKQRAIQIGQAMVYLVNIENGDSKNEEIERNTSVGVSSCTGFLVSKNIVVTNRHCVMSCERDGAVSSIMLWPRSEQTSSSQAPLIEDPVILNETQLLDKFKKIDVAFLKIPDGKIKNGLSLSFAKETPKENNRLTIFQYPNDEKGIGISSLQVNEDIECIIEGVRYDPSNYQDGTLKHRCDTAGSSSGSPIFNYQLTELVAIHNIGSDIKNSGYNEGIPVETINQLISSYYPSLSPKK